MQAKFVTQPFANGETLGEFIQHATGPAFDRIRMAVAWAKQSGLGRVRGHLESFRNRGGKVQLIIGVSEGGATEEGLDLALQLADDAYVFHDPRRTFHPKVYLATGPAEAALLVGSGNLSAGGIGWNYEAGLWLDGTFSPSGSGPFNEAGSWIDRLLNEPALCLPLTAKLIQDLKSSPDILIGREAAGRRRHAGASAEPEDQDSQVTATVGGLFGKPSSPMKPLPPHFQPIPGPTHSGSGLTVPSKPTSRIPAAMVLHPISVPNAGVVRRWYKTLDNTAAQVPRSPNSNPTGNLRLSQEAFSIDWRTYFRDQFFAGLPWTARVDRVTEQEVEVAFEVFAAGASQGVEHIRVSHDPLRISNQGNVPTVLHWGPLAPLLKAYNFVGWHVTLERTQGNGFRLFLLPQPTGIFVQ